MSNFYDIVYYEYKKIFKRKSTYISLVITFFTIVISCFGLIIGSTYIDGVPAESKYEAMVTDRENGRALSGTPIDIDLIRRTKEAYSKVKSDQNYYLTNEFEMYARPYSEIRHIISSIYTYRIDALKNLDEGEMSSFYEIRDEKIASKINSSSLNKRSKEKLISINNKVNTPFIYEYSEGYKRFLALIYSTGVFTCFAIAICLAPMFSGEYSSGADQLILSSKYGKNKVILAKLFTGITFTTIICFLNLLITFTICMIIYGFDGAMAPLQLYSTLSVYPFNMLQAALIASLCVLVANIMTSSITLLLSSLFKTPFGVIIIVNVLTFIPLMVIISDTNTIIYNIYHLLPANMMDVWNVFSPILYEIAGLSIEPYIILPLFGLIITAILLPFSYRAFKQHQIS
jgi:ABC-type transport system involved in multi-copper enzyme maturation permease subunit